MAIQSVVNVNIGQAFSPPNNDVASANHAAARSAAPQQQQVSKPEAKPEAKPEPAASAAEVREAAEKINKVLRTVISSNLEFSVDQDSGRTIVRVVDIQTKDVIRQIPNEETLAIAKSLGQVQGLLIRQKA